MNAEIGRPAAGEAALLVVDMINPLDFDGADQLFAPALAAARAVRGLTAAARRAGVPVVYVNDNFGQWHSERTRLVDHCREGSPRAAALLAEIAPEDDDYFVIKPQFSGFYSTNLAVLLPKLGATRLIITGLAADICVLFTAADAHMRDYRLWVPADCVAASRAADATRALALLTKAMGAEVRPTADLPLAAWLDHG